MLNKDFKEFAGLLNSIGVEYLIVGGYALAAHGHPRYLDPGAIVQLGYPPSRIDLLTAIDGVEFDLCQARRVVMHISGVDLPIIGLDDFRANKRASGCAKDLAAEYSDIRLLVQAPRCLYDSQSLQIQDSTVRTNIDIDDELLSAAMRASGCKTKRATVEEGLRLLARKKVYGSILALRGKIHWDGEPEALRRTKRR